MKRYEYTAAKLQPENQLDQLDAYGSSGWELVSVISNSTGERAYFKRPVTKTMDNLTHWCIQKTHSDYRPETWCGRTGVPEMQMLPEGIAATTNTHRICKTCAKTMAGALLTRADTEL